MKARARRSGRSLAVNLACLAVAIVAALFVVLGRRDDGAASVAFAAPGASLRASQSVTVPAPAAAAALFEAKDAGAATGETPIDLAIAPDGGVPVHPGASHFRSPFARPAPGPVARVKVGMLLNSVDGYDVKSGTFTADFFLSLTSTVPMPPLSLQFPNGALDKKEDIADKPTFKLYRLTGSFKSPADLRRYPFDSQELKIVVEDDSRGVDQLELVVDHDRTQLARGFRAVGWQVSFVEGRAQSQSYPDRFENDDLFYSRYTFSVGLDRFATSAAFKVYVPAFIIVLIALLGMWVPPEEMEVRSNSGAPMLAGAVLFHFALIQELPSTSYLTRADKLMLGVYLSLALGMVSTWCMFLVKEERVALVFRLARVIVPVASAVVMAAACFA